VVVVVVVVVVVGPAVVVVVVGFSGQQAAGSPHLRFSTLPLLLHGPAVSQHGQPEHAPIKFQVPTPPITVHLYEQNPMHVAQSGLAVVVVVVLVVVVVVQSPPVQAPQGIHW